MRCDHCGVEQRHVLGTAKTYCAPPFMRQRHSFTGLHPADIAERNQAAVAGIGGRRTVTLPRDGVVHIAEASFNAGWDAAIQACIAEGFCYRPMPGDRLAVENFEAWKRFSES